MARGANTSEASGALRAEAAAEDPTFTGSCPARAGDYEFTYALMDVVPYEHSTEFGVFADEADAQKLAEEFNIIQKGSFLDSDSSWRVEKRVSFKPGGQPREVTIHYREWRGQIKDDAVSTDVRELKTVLYEHQISNQQLMSPQISENYSTVTVSSIDAGEADKVIAEIIREQSPKRLQKHLEYQKKRAEEDAEQIKREAAKKENEAKRKEKRAKRLAAKGLPEDHEGPTDPVENVVFHMQRGQRSLNKQSS